MRCSISSGSSGPATGGMTLAAMRCAGKISRGRDGQRAEGVTVRLHDEPDVSVLPIPAGGVGGRAQQGTWFSCRTTGGFWRVPHPIAGPAWPWRGRGCSRRSCAGGPILRRGDTEPLPEPLSSYPRITPSHASYRACLGHVGLLDRTSKLRHANLREVPHRPRTGVTNEQAGQMRAGRATSRAEEATGHGPLGCARSTRYRFPDMTHGRGMSEVFRSPLLHETLRAGIRGEEDR